MKIGNGRKLLIGASVVLLALSACAPRPGTAALSDGEVEWLSRTGDDYKARVPASYTLERAQAVFRPYCARRGMETRSIRIMPPENGKRLVIGSCLDV